MLDLPDGFREPDWQAPLDIDAYRDRTPDDVRLRGHFFSLVQDEARKRGVEPTRATSYYSFKLYPVTEFFDLIEDVLPRMYPRKSMREGLRELGRSAYTSFFQTRIGKLMYGMMGKSPGPALKMAEKGYGVTITRGRAEVLDASDRHVTLAIRDMYTFLDSYHVGLVEGMVAHYDCLARVGIRRHSDVDADIIAMWVPRL